MTAWPAAALLFLLAVPFDSGWQDFEAARRGLLALLAAMICLLPGGLPQRRTALPPLRRWWPLALLPLWCLARSFGDVHNTGYALESAAHLAALLVCALYAARLAPAAVALAALPAGIAVALWTLAQACGLLLPPGNVELVSTLGNRNAASEVLALCGALAALLLAGRPALALARGARPLAALTLAVCATALVLNGSRSGLIALPLGCLPALFLPGRWQVLAGLALGAGAGLVLPVSAPAPAPAAGSAAAAATMAPAAQELPSTVAVRLALWEGGLEMVADRPLLGHGSGQFVVEYPRYRSEEEIELSSFGRKFVTAPRSVHNDYLQLAIEGGLPALLLLAALVVLLLRSCPLSHLGPLLTFGALAAVRSPLGNAPAAAAIWLFFGALLGNGQRPADTPAGRRYAWQRPTAWAAGILLLVPGLSQLVSQFHWSAFLTRWAAKTDPEGQQPAIDAVLRWRPFDHNALYLRARGALLATPPRPDAAAVDIDVLGRLAPFDTSVLLERARLWRVRNRPERAFEVLTELLRLDPRDPMATLWIAELLVEQDRPVDAVYTLYRDPHPALRRRLARLLGDLADAAAGRETTATYLRTEQAFVRTIDLLEQEGGADLAGAHMAWKDFLTGLEAVGGSAGDMRSIVLGAVLALHAGDRDQVPALAGAAAGRELLSVHRALLREVIEPLRAFPTFWALLAERA